MIPLKPRERIVLTFIFEFHAEYKNSPLVSEITARCQFAGTTVRYVLGRLQMKGYIDWVQVGSRRLIVPLWKE